jgi:hypothetical protein
MNIVFDKWDENDNPIPNFNYLNEKVVCDAISYPIFLDGLDLSFNVKKCKLSDITLNDNFYYIIQHMYNYQHFLKNGLIDFSEKIKEQITNNNLKVMFISPHESPEHLDIFVGILSKMVKNNNWDESQFYIINNNSLIYKLKEKLNSNINFYKINALLKFPTIDITIKPKVYVKWDDKDEIKTNKFFNVTILNPKFYEESLKIKPIESEISYDKKFIFLCQNRQPHFHRVALLTHLKTLKLLENDITDWSLVIDYSTYTKNIQSISHLKGYVDVRDKTLIKDYLEITKTKRLSYYEKNVNWFDNVEDYVQIKHSTIDSYKNSYINIVTESKFNFTENDIHISEKTFKPFYYFQIPIFLASYNHVKMIRKEYDFYLFDDLIDHSYDSEVDDIKRFHMVVAEIKRLSTMKEEISIYYKTNIDKIIHNHNFVKTYPERKIEENYFLNLINENK